MAATPWTSRQTLTHRPHRMHLDGSRTSDGLDASTAGTAFSRRNRAGPALSRAASRRSSQVSERAQARQSCGCAARISSTTIRRASRTAFEWVQTTIPSLAGQTHAATRVLAPSTSQTQTRHAPPPPRAGWWQSVGMSMPMRLAASRMVAPGSTSTGWPSIKSLTRSMANTSPSCVPRAWPSPSARNRAQAALGGTRSALDALGRVDGVEGESPPGPLFVARGLGKLHGIDGLGRSHLDAAPAPAALVQVDHVRRQLLANPRRAALLTYVRFVLVPEVAQRAEDRVGRRLTQAAKGRLLDGLRQALQEREVVILPLAPGDAFEDVEHRLGPFAAGHTRAARLVLGELQEELGDVDHTGVRVHADEAAGAHRGARGHQGIVLHGNVQVPRGDAAAGRPARLGRLELLPPGNA